MNFLRGQDDFFQTANQPISVRNLSQPYNKPKNSYAVKNVIFQATVISTEKQHALSEIS